MSQTRRLAAILAADVAGYSRLMGADEEGTLAALKAIRRELGDPKIAEHRGRIVKTTGDGLLVEFQSVVDAVRCAVEVQQGMPERNAAVPEGERIEFRIGIHQGDIIVEDDDIFGDGVNIAARLVASSVVGAIEPRLRLSEIERASRKPTASLGAYDLYLRALAQSYRFTEEGLEESVVSLRQALALDPSYAPAAAMVGWCRTIQRVQGWGALSDEDVADAVRLARQALEAARDDPETMWRAAHPLFILAGEAALAAAVLDRALALNPNAAGAWMVQGWLRALRDGPEAAIEACERALRLSPFDPLGYLNACGFAIAHLVARRFEQAIEWADRTLRDQPRVATAIRINVVANAHLGRLDEARAALSRMLAIDPKFTITTMRALLAPLSRP